MVLQYANSGNFNVHINSNFILNWPFSERIEILKEVIKGLRKIHENNMVHRDFHTGNILSSLNSNLYASTRNYVSEIYISDMGLCGEVGISNNDETNIYGVMPYVAPEVLRGKPYTQAADIYSFGMIMYFVATRRQPFANRAHDNILAMNICSGIRPEINDQEIPECYINLMERCWDSNPDNRPSATEIEKLIDLFYSGENKEFIEQIEKVDDYRKINFLSIENNQNDQATTIHPQAFYTSRLLNPFTKDLVIDFTK
jgi:serine/threonine protein kinase